MIKERNFAMCGLWGRVSSQKIGKQKKKNMKLKCK